MRNLSRFITHFFVLWILAGAVAAFAMPDAFQWFKPWIPCGLGLIMFGMGITLTVDDFKRVAKQPRGIFVGVAAQYLIMPLVGFGLAKLFQLPPALAAGVILVGCCPGGTASNLVTYLARADVALSVTLTSISTIIGVAATPTLTWLLAGQYVPIDVKSLLIDCVLIILFPVAAGLIVHKLLGQKTEAWNHLFPTISVLFIVLIVSCVVALSRDKLQTTAPLTFLVVILHNAFGLGLGYALAKLCGLTRIACRTVSIEVGMQNSGLGVALSKNLGGDPLAALPSAIFSVWQNISGPALANWWSRRVEHAKEERG